MKELLGYLFILFIVIWAVASIIINLNKDK